MIDLGDVEGQRPEAGSSCWSSHLIGTLASVPESELGWTAYQNDGFGGLAAVTAPAAVGDIQAHDNRAGCESVGMKIC